MPSERERGVLVGVKKTLVEAAPVTDPALERTILPPEVTGQRLQPEPKRADSQTVSSTPDDVTKPATFHLPLVLIQRLRATCRLKNTTMVEFVRQAIEEALERHRPTEEEIRRLLG